MPQRLQQLELWLKEGLGIADYTLAPASSDASFRRYFRIVSGGESRIVMDAPPEKEDCGPFVKIARELHAIGLHVPEILAEDLDQGFLLLSDLGSTPYLDVLNDESVEQLYGDAMEALTVLQSRGPGEGQLPAYDRTLLMNEMGLFRDWYLGEHLGLSMDETAQRDLEDSFSLLADVALEQPRVAVHRDYPSRNLMVCERNPGIIDFQDAVFGPMSYDLVSLLRDCYIAWPRERVEGWALGFRDRALEQGIIDSVDDATFLRWFDLMGVQRHLKASGIFARLNHRDGKPGYLNDIPRTLGYVREVVGRYPELASLQPWL